MKTKICKVCKTSKPLHRFATNKSYYLNKCKDCRNKQLKFDRRLKNPENYIIKTTKECRVCKLNKPFSEFRSKKGWYGDKSIEYSYLTYCCKKCEKDKNITKMRKYRSKLSIKERKDIYLKWKNERTKEERLALYKKHREARREEIHKYVYKQISEITDNYCLTSLRLHKIPKNFEIRALIKLCRSNIKLKRKLKQNKNAKKNKSGKSKKQ